MKHGEILFGALYISFASFCLGRLISECFLYLFRMSRCSSYMMYIAAFCSSVARFAIYAKYHLTSKLIFKLLRFSPLLLRVSPCQRGLSLWWRRMTEL